MSTAELILKELHSLRPDHQSEVLDFVSFLRVKEGKTQEQALQTASLISAMRGMENEESLYTEADLIGND